MNRIRDSAQLQATIMEASGLLATDPRRAAGLAAAALNAAPDDPRALLILASSRRRLGDAVGAKTILAPLALRYPRAAHTQYELGLVHMALSETQPAIASLECASRLKPDLAEAWLALGDLLFANGDEVRAAAAFSSYERALITSPALQHAADHLFSGRPAEAERLLRDRLAQQGDDLEALRLLATTVAKQGRDAEAESLFDLYLQHQPDDDGARFSRAETLFRRNKGGEALDCLRALIGRQPEHPAYRNLLAAVLVLVGDYAEAIVQYEGLVAQFPEQPKIWLAYGHALRILDRREDTIAAYRRAIVLRPDLGEAYWSLANLKTVRFARAEEEAMRASLHAAGSDDDRLHLHFALGKACEDRADYAASFRHYAAGSALRRRLAPYDAAAHTSRMHLIRDVSTSAFFSHRKDGGFPSGAPIFILGLPRSGSTLVEQILASHTAVEGTMELAEIGLIAAEVRASHPSRSYSETLAGLDPDQRTALGRSYIERTRIHRRLGRDIFIDKMPNNFEHIPLIQLLLPNARIIDVRRHPMAACFSAFKQHFARGQDFSYDLSDLGHFYRDYVDLMAHFDAVLPGRIHRVLYEDLIADTEQEVRRLLDYCCLPFEDECLRFHENRRAVRTVSSEQVREPLHSHGLDQWRHYERWLQPLRDALGPKLAA